MNGYVGNVALSPNKRLKMKIDISKYQTKQDEGFIRKIFFNSQDLRLLLAIINNHQPMPLTEITNIFNKFSGNVKDRATIYKKIERFLILDLMDKKNIASASKGTTLDLQIIKKHKEALGKSPAFKQTIDTTDYYFLTEKGGKWIPIIDEIQSKSQEQAK